MLRTIQAEGRTVQVPDDATPQEVNAIFHPANGTPVGGDLRAGDSRSLFDKLTTTTPDNPQDSAVKRGANWLSNVGASGLKTLWQIAGSPTTGTPGPYAGVDLQGGLKANLPHDNPIHAAMEAAQYISQHKLDTSAELVGQAGGMGVADPANLEAAGEGLQRLGGSVADRTALGSNPLDRRFGASPGRGISGNRIVAGTKAGLKAKVDAALPRLASDRAAILDQSAHSPVDVRSEVDQPFADLQSRMTNSKTGVADPAEIRSLTRARAAVGFQQDPLTGQPLSAGPGEGPLERDLEHMSPSEIAEFNSNLRSMANYKANAESPLAQQALKGAGHNLRTKLNEIAPEAQPATQQLYNTESAQDILQRQLPANEGGGMLTPSTTLAGMVKNAAAPVIRGAGTTAAAGLDLAGGGMKTLANKLKGATAPPAGPPPAGTSITLPPPTPPSGPAGPVPPPPQMASPNATPTLPETAGMSRATPIASPPPNVRLVDRVRDFPRKIQNTQPPPGDIHGVPGARVQGPEGPGQFELSPRRLPASTGGQNAVQESSSAGVLPRQPEATGSQGGGRGGMGQGKQRGEAAQKGGGGTPAPETGTLSSKVNNSNNGVIRRNLPPHVKELRDEYMRLVEKTGHPSYEYIQGDENRLGGIDEELRKLGYGWTTTDYTAPGSQFKEVILVPQKSESTFGVVKGGGGQGPLASKVGAGRPLEAQYPEDAEGIKAFRDMGFTDDQIRPVVEKTTSDRNAPGADEGADRQTPDIGTHTRNTRMIDKVKRKKETIQ